VTFCHIFKDLLVRFHSVTFLSHFQGSTCTFPFCDFFVTFLRISLYFSILWLFCHRFEDVLVLFDSETFLSQIWVSTCTFRFCDFFVTDLRIYLSVFWTKKEKLSNEFCSVNCKLYFSSRKHPQLKN